MGNTITTLQPTDQHLVRFLDFDAEASDFVIVHGRFSGFGAPMNWIAADIVRIKNGILVEHWDVIQDEAAKEQSKSGNPMFGETFPEIHAK